MKRKFNYSYIMIALCFLCVCLSLGLCSSGRNMYLTAITDALNIKRGAFSLNDTFRFITTTVISIFLGRLINKFGTKILVCFGFACLIGFALINSVAETLFVFYIGGVLLGVGLAMTGTSMMSIVVNRWCDKNRGLITGAVLSANGLGGALTAQLLTPIIFEEGNPFGYRTSYTISALVLSVMLLLIILFFKERPRGAEKKPVSTVKRRKIRGTGWVGVEYSEVVRKPYFYVSLLCMALTGMALQGLGGIATPHMYDVGISKSMVANITTASNVFLITAKFLSGFLYDRLGIKITMNISYICSFVSLICLVFVSNTPFGIVIAFARLPFSNAALPLETVMLPFFAAEMFGNKPFDRVVGYYTAASTVGFAVGAPFANFCYDLFGNYNLPFIIFACFMLFTTVAMQFVITKAHKDKEIILKSIQEKITAEAGEV